jgi:hypothetical protein
MPPTRRLAPRAIALSIAVVLAVFAACGDSSRDPTPRVPLLHRATADVCAENVTSPCAPDAGPLACTTDDECIHVGWTIPMGASCAAVIWGARCVSSACVFDTCLRDEDCPSGGACSCRGTTRGGGGSSWGNVCVPGNCRVDADCGPGWYCSPTADPGVGPFYGVAGHYCHTPDDACVDDGDCLDASYYCAYSREVGHWACSNARSAG